MKTAAQDSVTSGQEGNRDETSIEVSGREVRLTSLDKVLYPENGFTKADLIDYYAAIAPVMLPHLRDRPVTLRRFPDGVTEDGFWEKHCPESRPDWVRTAKIRSESSARGIVEYCLVNDLPTLLWLANLGTIEFHLSLARAKTRATPTVMVFDLDPGEPSDILDCAGIALLIRDTLGHQQLDSLAKVSGSKGIQVYVPLNYRARYERTSGFAHDLARTFEEAMPDRVVSRMRKALRPGKVLIDWSQNSEHKTTVAVYSMRARENPSVSMPVNWKTVEQALDEGDRSLLQFSAQQALEVVASGKDRFSPVLETRQQLARRP